MYFADVHEWPSTCPLNRNSVSSFLQLPQPCVILTEACRIEKKVGEGYFQGFFPPSPVLLYMSSFGALLPAPLPPKSVPEFFNVHSAYLSPLVAAIKPNPYFETW